MKILWITNTPIGPLGEKLYGKPSDGVWMSALLSDFEKAHEHQVVVATTAAVSEPLKVTDESGIVFYALPNSVPLIYSENKSGNTAAWKKLLADEQPDLIQIWGTEFTHGLCALRVAGKIPSVIYMQGYLGSIARHYLAGISHRELKKTVTFRDMFKRDSIEQQQQKYYASTKKEKEMFCLAGAIICENDWCEDSVRAVVPQIDVYRCPLSVNHVFSTRRWDKKKAEKYSVICTASGYPLKGLHMVLRAIALLKEDYPDIKLYVPGTKMVSDGSIKWMLRKRGYTKYIEKLIRKLDIEKHIVWLGRLTQEQLAEQYAQTQVFVLSSSIENHSSSLKEAMMVGTPSVASAVGGVPEYVRHGENGFLYRFEEYEIMAGYIRKLFEDDELACRFSENGRNDMKQLHEDVNILQSMTKIYEQVLGAR